MLVKSYGHSTHDLVDVPKFRAFEKKKKGSPQGVVGEEGRGTALRGVLAEPCGLWPKKRRWNAVRGGGPAEQLQRTPRALGGSIKTEPPILDSYTPTV